MSTINLTSGAFITTWETTSTDESITIPTTSSSEDYNFTISWGDGTTESVVGVDPNPSHTYSTPGNHTVKIYANPGFNKAFPQIFFDDEFTQNDNTKKIESIEQWGSVGWQSMNAAFSGCSNLSYNADDAPDLSKVTDISFMFKDVNQTISLTLGDWNTSGITDMESTFDNIFNGEIQGIGNWDMSSVEYTADFLNGTTVNNSIDFSGWDLSNLVDASGMFGVFDFGGTINGSSWGVRNLTTAAGMFNGFVGDIVGADQWDVSNLSSANFMFRNYNLSYDLREWDVSSITTASGFFGGGSASDSPSEEVVAKTLAGWVDPEVNRGSNAAADLNSGVSFGATPDIDYNNLDQYSVGNASTGITTGKEAVDALCSDPPNWTIDMGGTEPADCT